MNFDPLDDGLEREFLEQNMRDILQGRRDQDLADSVRLAMEADDQEGEKMTTISADKTWTIDEEKPHRTHRKFWTYLANAASVAAIFFLIAINWKSGAEPIPENGMPKLNPLMQDQDEIEDHNEEFRPVEVRNMKDVRTIKPGTLGINASGDGVTDEVVSAICRTQPQLTHLELRHCWVTGRGMQEIRRLRNLQSLNLSSNQYIDRSGWMVVGDLKKIKFLNLAVFLGQTADVVDDNQNTPQPPKKGIEAGPFLIPVICSLPELEHLNISGFAMTPPQVRNLSRGVAESLTTIDISFTRLKSSTLTFFGTCKNLRNIRALGMAKGEDFPLTPFVLFKELTELTIGAGGMSTVAFEQSQLEVLLNAKNLKRLEFVRVNFGPDQIMQFVERVKRKKRDKNGIQALRFISCSGLSDKECEDLKTMPAIKEIAVVNCKGMSTEGLLHLTRSRATHLDVRHSLKGIKATPVIAALSKRPELSIRISKEQETLTDFQGFIEEDMGDQGVVLKAQPKK